MHARKTFTTDEIARAKAVIDAQLKAYRAVADAAEISPNDEDLNEAVDYFNSMFFNNLVLVLDRFFVDRDRSVVGTAPNPLNELEMICDSLMYNDGVFRTDTDAAYSVDDSMLNFAPGQRIILDVDEFTRLSAAVFVELDERFSA